MEKINFNGLQFVHRLRIDLSLFFCSCNIELEFQVNLNLPVSIYVLQVVYQENIHCNRYISVY